MTMEDGHRQNHLSATVWRPAPMDRAVLKRARKSHWPQTYSYCICAPSLVALLSSPHFLCRAHETILGDEP